MSKYTELAMERRKLTAPDGRPAYSCCQSVAAIFAEDAGYDEESAMKAATFFRGGMQMGSVCGAVTGMGLVAGLVYGDDTPDCKKAMYPKVRELSDAFKAQFGSIVCAELLNGVVTHGDPPTPEARTTEYYKRRSCLDCVRTAAEILAKDLEANERL